MKEIWNEIKLWQKSLVLLYFIAIIAICIKNMYYFFTHPH